MTTTIPGGNRMTIRLPRQNGRGPMSTTAPVWMPDGTVWSLVADRAGAPTSTALADDDGDGVDDDAAPVVDENAPPPPAERTPADQVFDPPEGGVAFTIPVAVLEGYETSDGRFIEPGALGHRALPLTLMAMRRNADGGWGHAAAVIAGRVDTLERYDASSTVNPETSQPYGAGIFAWRATGYLNNVTDEEQDTVRLIRDRTLRGISIDMGEARSDIEVTEEDDEGWPIAIRETITQGSTMGMTVCPFAAFPGAYIELDAEPDALAASAARRPGEGEHGIRILDDGRCVTCDGGDTIVASAGQATGPSAAYFADPQLPGPTPVTITDPDDQGYRRVFGHLAAWGTCHTGVADACVVPPRSATSYALFRTGAVRTADGTDVSVGQLTTGTGHASIRMGIAPAIAHYDDTGTAWADVAAGDDAHGVWINGVTRDLTDDQVRNLRAASLSGDWRKSGGGLELVAALTVNVPGFPIPRAPEARVASGVPTALVAAGVRATRLATDGRGDVARHVDTAVERALRPFIAREALRIIRGQ